MLRSAHFAVLAALLPCAIQASAQYGPVDPAEASERVLGNSMSTRDATQVFRALNEWNLPEWQNMLPKFLAHEKPEIRVAAVAIIGRDDSADLPAALGALESPAHRTIALRELILANELTVENAEAILDIVEIEPILTAMLYSIDRSRDTADSIDALTAMTKDTEMPTFARGVAASELAERGDDAPLRAWLSELDELSKSNRNRVLYELAVLSNQLDSAQTSVILMEESADMPVDDLLRATTTAAAIRLAPEAGIPAWQRMMQNADSVKLRGALATMLLEIDAPAPSDSLGVLDEGPPLHQKLKTLLEIPPQSRFQGAHELVHQGHLPTMSWAIKKASELEANAETEALLNAILDKAQATPRPAFLKLANRSAIILARSNPESLIERLGQTDSPIFREIIFSALAIAATTRAADATSVLLNDTALANRSMALLVVARTQELNEKQVKLLGRAAAGGGRLPSAFRPSAAWLYLHHVDKLQPSISRILAN
jgi:hypothetical protein